MVAASNRQQHRRVSFADECDGKLAHVAYFYKEDIAETITRERDRAIRAAMAEEVKWRKPQS